MLKVNFKSAFFTTLVSTLILLAGCSSPEEKKAAQIQEALSLAAEGDAEEAINILESLTEQYPNDIGILQSIGSIYADQGDATMAAFFLEQAHLQSPGDTELLLQAYRSVEAANQSAGPLLEKLADQAPQAMTPELWIRLGQIRQAANQVQPALDAYLKGVDPEQRKPSPDTAASIGQLYAKAGNLPQSKTWLEIAADSDDPNALTALFGLLEINLREKDWTGAEAVIKRLDTQFPGAVEASQWQQARQELIRWRQAQDEMKAKLAAAEAAKKAAEAKAAAEAQAAAQAEAANDNDAQTTQTETEDPDSQATEVAQKESSESTSDEGKAQIITDLEAMEAMADAPAIEVETGAQDPATDSGQRITFNPSIAIEPADPEVSFQVDFDQAPLAGQPNYSIDTTPPVQPAEPADNFPTPTTQENAAFEPAPPIQPFVERPVERPVQRPSTVEELLADAEMAEVDRDFKSAIRKYWAAISITNNRADVWNLLSRAYLVDGQMNNAETAGLEAVRLAPREVAYTLDYLRVAQRTKQPEVFLRELETAYARFPTSPEITLSLARAHERISQQTETARNLYLRFIDIAPNHPLVPEARAATERL